MTDELSDDPTFRSGLAHHSQGRLREAEAAYRRVLLQDAGHVDAGQMLGVVAYQTGHADAAVTLLGDLVARHPERGDLHTNLALALEFSGRFEAAEQAGRRALACSGRPPQALGNHANVLRQLWKLAEAEVEFVEALRLSPQNAGLHYNFALCLLAKGALSAGWREFEWRKALMPPARSSGHPWDGRAAPSAILAVHSEQGLGDTLLFSRFLKALPPGMTLELDIQPPLARLLAANFPDARILSPSIRSKADFDASLLSLPALLNGSADPRRAGRYLRAPLDAADLWKERVKGLPGRKVGLVWAGGSRPGEVLVEAVDARRSLTIDRLGEILDTPAVSFVCLQKERREGAPGRAVRTWCDWTSELEDMADTAALIEALDLVISVDTAVAHLAGALGRPVWVLSRHDSCWRWPAGGRPEWYASARQFRQGEPGVWDEPIAQAARALRELAA